MRSYPFGPLAGGKRNLKGTVVRWKASYALNIGVMFSPLQIMEPVKPIIQLRAKMVGA